MSQQKNDRNVSAKKNLAFNFMEINDLCCEMK